MLINILYLGNWVGDFFMTGAWRRGRRLSLLLLNNNTVSFCMMKN
nr:MAG TPA: hypothetical protein [Caudoviricetes sp.]